MMEYLIVASSLSLSDRLTVGHGKQRPGNRR